MPPKATIVFVDLSTDDIPWEGEASLTTKLGDSVHLLEALAWIFDVAGDRPCVVNISLGTNGGPHDGSTPFEQAIDSLVATKPNRAVVVAAANTYAQHIHAMGKVPDQGFLDITWVIPKIGPGPTELEIWYAKDDLLDAELLDQTEKSFGRVALGDTGRVKDGSGNTLVFISHRKADPLNGDNVIGIFLEKSLTQPSWTVRLHGKKIVKNGEFHAWIERNDTVQTLFKGPLTADSHTLGSLSCGHDSIMVGSYNARFHDYPISSFSSAGPTRDGRNKPEISAPGHQVVAARSGTKKGVIPKSGTSMAAPAVAGAIAVMLSETFAVGIRMNSKDIRKAVVASARLGPPANGQQWDTRYGHGRISAAAMLLQALKAKKRKARAAAKPQRAKAKAAPKPSAARGQKRKAPAATKPLRTKAQLAPKLRAAKKKRKPSKGA